MDFVQSIILGIVEGLTEFLPISSTAHLILISQALSIEQTSFLKNFEIAIQLGAILAVVVLYWRKFLLDFESIKKIAIAFVPTAIIGFIFYKLIKEFLMSSDLVIASALFTGGLILILFESGKGMRTAQNGSDIITYKQAFLIGLFQSLAVIPGVSRSAATIIGGLSMKLSRQSIVEFSFLLAAPTMLAATGYDMLKSGFYFSGHELQLLAVGFFISFVTAILGIKFFLKFIATHNFYSFGIYRVLLGMGVLIWIYLG